MEAAAAIFVAICVELYTILDGRVWLDERKFFYNMEEEVWHMSVEAATSLQSCRTNTVILFFRDDAHPLLHLMFAETSTNIILQVLQPHLQTLDGMKLVDLVRGIKYGMGNSKSECIICYEVGNKWCPQCITMYCYICLTKLDKKCCVCSRT
jgi:hypothetical protein